MFTELPHDRLQAAKQKYRSLGPIDRQVPHSPVLPTLGLSIPEKKKILVWLSTIICFLLQPNTILTNTHYQIKSISFFKEKKNPRLIVLTSYKTALS